ncbi:HAD family hydrolase [Kineococcus sp. SYSU DK003]|uniref:HAD family hydrolase n=1 Tax=Kineococcus sp. SYSU DK003 TaxID=3383124 RepID=UPI003D7EE8EE
MAINAVIFDLDGTLFDHPSAALTGLRTWIEQLGRHSTPALEAAWTAAEERHFNHWRDGHISFDEQRRRRLRDVLPLLDLPVGDDAELDQLFTIGYLPAYQTAWAAYPDVEAALSDLHTRGLQVAVLTNGTHQQQNDKITAIGLADRLGPVLTAEQLGVAKPRPQAFLTACARLGLAPQQAVYVGDNHVVDVLAARAAGLHAIHLDRDNTGPLQEAARIHTLADLAGLLAHLDASGGDVPRTGVSRTVASPARTAGTAG